MPEVNEYTVHPPLWASVFAEDEVGLYAEMELADAVFIRFRWIPPGRFTMGSPESEKGREDDEGPQHEVRITLGYWMAETQTTQAQWMAVMGKNPSRFKGEDLPVEQVNGDDVQGFMEKLEFEVKLPTEAEWEYACRAGTVSAFNNGSDCTQPSGKDPALENLGWYDENSGKETHPVKGKEANAWGLYDMHGNVWEWCEGYRRDYTDKIQIDPSDADHPASRALRGGCYWYVARWCRSAYRYDTHRVSRNDNIGFRLVAGQ